MLKGFQGLKTGIFLVGLWQVLISYSQLPSYLLPSPYQVLTAIHHNASLLIWHGFLTFSQVIAGLGIATLMGIIMALSLDRYSKIQEFIQPILVVLQAIPSFILMPLLMIWLGYGLLPKMMVVCLSCFFPITLCLLGSLKRTPKEWLELAEVMKGKPFQILKQVRWPAALPGLFSGLRLAAIHAPLTVLAADWNGANEGLGYLIMLCHGRLQIDLMFACLLCTVFLTLLLNRLIILLEKKFIFWPALS